MADSILELIMQNVKTTLETITTGNGYSNTIASVQRFSQSGQVLASTPVCVLMQGGDNVDSDGPLAGASSLVTRSLTVSVVIIHRQNLDIDTRSASEAMNSLIQDVQKAMLADYTRGNNAIDTSEIGIGELDSEEGEPELVQTVGFKITYRHRRTDPTSKT
jgi:hypothetical protein